MPNRILKESIWRSESLNKCSLEAQSFFLRLIPYPDDFGRFDARLPIIRATLYPLKYDEVTDGRIESWLQEVVAQGMIRLYQVGGVRYGFFTTWAKHQQQRVKKSKYPEPPKDDDESSNLISDDIIRNQMIADANKCRDESESEYEYESNTNKTFCPGPSDTDAPGPPPTPPQIVISIPIKGKVNGKDPPMFNVTEDIMAEYRTTFPGLDVLQCLRECRQWNLDNPDRRKTKTGIRKHITLWLSRDNDKGRNRASATGGDEDARWQRFRDMDGKTGKVVHEEKPDA